LLSRPAQTPTLAANIYKCIYTYSIPIVGWFCPFFPLVTCVQVVFIPQDEAAQDAADPPSLASAEADAAEDRRGWLQ